MAVDEHRITQSLILSGYGSAVICGNSVAPGCGISHVTGVETGIIQNPAGYHCDAADLVVWNAPDRFLDPNQDSGRLNDLGFFLHPLGNILDWIRSAKGVLLNAYWGLWE